MKQIVGFVWAVMLGFALILGASPAQAAGYWQQMGDPEAWGTITETGGKKVNGWDIWYILVGNGGVDFKVKGGTPKNPVVTRASVNYSMPPLFIEPGVPVVVKSFEIIHEARNTDAMIGAAGQLVTFRGLDANRNPGCSELVRIFPMPGLGDTYISGKAGVYREQVNDKVVYGEKGIDYPDQVFYMRFSANLGGHTAPDYGYRYEWRKGPVPADLRAKEAKRIKDESWKPKPESGGGTGTSGGGTSTGQGNHIGPYDPLPDSIDGFAILAGRGNVEPGSDILVEIEIRQAQDLANANLLLTYDPKVLQSSGKPAKGKLISKALFESNAQEPGTLRLGFASSSGVTGDGILTEIPFKAIGQPGAESPLKLELEVATSSAGASVSPLLIDGLVKISGGGPGPDDQVDPDPDVIDKPEDKPVVPKPEPEPSVIPGDYDKDGALTANDALTALRMSLRLLPQDKAMDMDKDGKVTANDATLILKKVVGK